MNNKDNPKRRVRSYISIVCIICLIITSFMLGGYCFKDSYAATGQLTAKGDTWQSGDTATVICQRDGRYKIDITGGGYAAGDYYDKLSSVLGQTFGYNNYIQAGDKLETVSKNVGGGHLVGEMNLKKGDVVNVTRFRAAVPKTWVSTAIGKGYEQFLYQPLVSGGDAMIVKINGTPVIGAGGCSGESFYINYDWDTPVRTMYEHRYVKLNPVTKIDNTKFSPGSSGFLYVHYRGSEAYGADKCWGARLRNGNPNYFGDDNFKLYGTVEGAETAKNGVSGYGEGHRAGTNYLNTSLVTLKSQPNDGITPNCKITCIEAISIAEDMYSASVRTASSLEQLVGKITDGIKVDVAVDNRGVESAINNLNSAIKSSSNNNKETTPPMTVIKGKSFDIWTTGVSNGGTSGSITIIDNDKKDNYIEVMGKINTSGKTEVVIDGKKYVFQVIEEPNSSNVNAVLN